jgi:hypothetical protein
MVTVRTKKNGFVRLIVFTKVKIMSTDKEIGSLPLSKSCIPPKKAIYMGEIVSVRYSTKVEYPNFSPSFY